VSKANSTQTFTFWSGGIKVTSEAVKFDSCKNLTDQNVVPVKLTSIS